MGNLNEWKECWIDKTCSVGLEEGIKNLLTTYHDDLVSKIKRIVEDLNKRELDFYKGDCTATRMYSSTCDDILGAIREAK